MFTFLSNILITILKFEIKDFYLFSKVNLSFYLFSPDIY